MLGFIKNVINKIRYNDEEEYDEYEEYEEYEEDEYEEDPRDRIDTKKREINNQRAKEKQGMFSNVKTASKSSNRVIVVKPNNFDDVFNYCDYLLDGKTIVINMEGLHIDISRRIIDVLTGTIYSIQGQVEKVSAYIIIATPKSVELSGDFGDIISNAYDTSNFNLKL